MDQQYKLLSTVCKLYDGEHYVMESEIRVAWKGCPSHSAILNLATEEYLQPNFDRRDPGYIPTPVCLQMVRERKRSNLILVVTIATLAAALLTLGLQVCDTLF